MTDSSRRYCAACGQLRRIVSWLLDEILDRDARPGHLTQPDVTWGEPI